MKSGRLLLIAFSACIVFTFLQRDNLNNIWQEYWAIHKSYKDSMYTPKIPAIDNKIEKLDPEAAAIINYKLNFIPRDEKEVLDNLSKNILKYPDNQFFIYELANCTCNHFEHGLDPRILLKLSDRLIQLDNNNGDYHYFKAFALLKLRKGNDFSEVIKELNKANECEYFKNPYSIYKERVLLLAQKQKLYSNLIEDLNYETPYNLSAKDICDDLIQYQNFLISEKDFAQEKEIANLIKLIMQKVPSFRNLFFFSSGFGFWHMPQPLELQRMDLTKEEADKKRLELCSYFNFDKVAESQKKFDESYLKIAKYAIAAFPFLFLSRLSFVFIILGIILLFIIFIRREKLVKHKTEIPAVIRYLIYIFIFILPFPIIFLCQVIQSDLECQCHSLNYSEIFNFPPILKELAEEITWRDLKEIGDAPFYFFLPFISFGIVIVMGITKFFKPKFDDISVRFVQGILLAIPMGLLTWIIQGHTYLKYISASLFILFAFKYSFRKVKIKTILQTIAGNSDEEHINLRADLFKLSAISFIICWIGVLLLTPPTFKSMQKPETEPHLYTFSSIGDPQKGYEEFLKKICDVNTSYMHSQYIGMVQSDDLPKVLQKIKERKTVPLWPFSYPGKIDVNENTIKQNYDNIIIGSLLYAGKDQLPILLNSMYDPEDEMALVARARFGDKTVKDALLYILDDTKSLGDKIDEIQSNNFERIPREFEIIIALSVISEPNETVDMVKKYFEAYPIEKVDGYFNYKGPNLLPQIYARQIMNFYVDKVEKEISSMETYQKDNALFPLRDTGGLYWDSQSAKKVLNLIMLTFQEDHFETFGIEYFLEADSSDLLLEGLKSHKDHIRAFCLSQLDKLGYTFKEDKLVNISKDNSWIVRANLCIIDKSKIKESEQSDYVKLIKSL
jgi:hypothetical protein